MLSGREEKLTKVKYSSTSYTKLLSTYYILRGTQMLLVLLAGHTSSKIGDKANQLKNKCPMYYWNEDSNSGQCHVIQGVTPLNYHLSLSQMLLVNHKYYTLHVETIVY